MIAGPCVKLDICTDDQINHYFQIGVKVYSKLLFSKLLITIKSQSHYLTLQENDYVVFLKIKVDYVKNGATLIKVSSVVTLRNNLPRTLGLV